MTTLLNEQHLKNERLAKKYCPLLVLYPEIEDGSRRKDHHHIGHGPGSSPPLDQDYHPRDIRLVLDNACLPGIKERPSREKVLEVMSENSVDYIDLIDRSGPKHVDKFWRVYAGIKEKDNNPEYQIFNPRLTGGITEEKLLATTPADLANSSRLSWKYIVKNGVVWEVSSNEEVDKIVGSR